MISPREALLKAIWDDANSLLSDAWIKSEIRRCNGTPDAPYADTGAIFRRLLDLGASPEDLVLLCRNSSLGGAFTTLVEIQMHFPEFTEISGIEAELLASDPSGGEARPGLAPQVNHQTNG